jgi:hypothetical protein
MKLNPNEGEHEELLKLIDRYDQEATTTADLALRSGARGIFKAEWTRLKKEDSGIDPFVREVVPERQKPPMLRRGRAPASD